MQERERLIVTSVLSVLLVGWLGFFVHRSPGFPGSGIGAVFGIAAAVLMLLPLAYPIAKRIPFFNTRMSRRISMQSLLTIHVYAGIFGPLLAIIHTGHKFDSLLGITLTAVMLLVVVNGYTLRYLLTYVSREISDTLSLLQTARGDLDHAWGILDKLPAEMRDLPRAPVFMAGLVSLGLSTRAGGPASEVMRIADSVADMEYAVRMHEFFKRWFTRSLNLHIGLSIIFYVLLALHIGSGIYFGLRWLQ